SINAMIWSRGHKNDWEYFAAEADDPGWSYESVLTLYRRLEDWQGTPDPRRRGKGRLVHVEPARDPNPIAPAMLEPPRSLGIPTFDDQNGETMEGDGGLPSPMFEFTTVAACRCFVHILIPIWTGTISRCSAARSWYASHSPGKRAVAVEFLRDGQSHRIVARREIVLCLGAVNTPKVLMPSGIGTRAGIVVVQRLPGVGRYFRDHIIAPERSIPRHSRPAANLGGSPSLYSGDRRPFFSTTRVMVNVGGPGAPAKPRSPARD